MSCSQSCGLAKLEGRLLGPLGRLGKAARSIVRTRHVRTQAGICCRFSCADRSRWPVVRLEDCHISAGITTKVLIKETVSWLLKRSPFLMGYVARRSVLKRSRGHIYDTDTGYDKCGALCQSVNPSSIACQSPYSFAKPPGTLARTAGHSRRYRM